MNFGYEGRTIMDFTNVIIKLSENEDTLGVVQVSAVVGYKANGEVEELSGFIGEDVFTEAESWEMELKKKIAQRFDLDENIIEIDKDVDIV
jgi:hypothetical protein